MAETLTLDAYQTRDLCDETAFEKYSLGPRLIWWSLSPMKEFYSPDAPGKLTPEFDPGWTVDLFFYSFSQYLLSAYDGGGPVQGAKDTAVNVTVSLPSRGLRSSRRGRK